MADAVTITTGMGLAAIAAGLAIAGGAIGTGLAQSAIGSAGVGAIVEKPEVSGSVLLYLVIPETILVMAFAVAMLVLRAIGGL